MNAMKNRYPDLKAIMHRGWQHLAMILLMAFCVTAQAQENAIESLSANQQGANVIVKITLKNPLAKPPVDFSITNPARIAFDFPQTTNNTGKTSLGINLGDVRNVNVVQAGDRTRLVFNLSRSLSYAKVIEGNSIIVTIDGSGAVATAMTSAGTPAAPVVERPSKQALRDIDFRRGVTGEGRVVVELPSNQVGVDVRQQGHFIIVDFMKTTLPEILRRRLDVTDFGTPVQSITTTQQGENVHMVIEPKGLWEHSAYQSDSQLVVEIKPVKEQPNKLTQGTQGYKGERLSLNFQNVEVRAVLQVIADFTGLNIITSDTVGGNLTLRLKDVPWDQALDIVMQAKGLDMRKNGSVLWIAPKDELLTKEKLELEQKSQIAELEPLRTESFQLNYQKADNFKLVLGITTNGSGGSGSSGSGLGNRILSKRGSATIDPRTNQIFVSDIPSKLEEIRALIQKVDVPTKQVLIEARIVEATDTFSRNLGAKLGFADLRTIRGGDAGYQIGSSNNRVAVTGNYQGVGEQTGQTPASQSSFAPNTQFINMPAQAINGIDPGNIAISLFSAAANRFLNLELSALEADGKGKIISSPRVVTADQLKATIELGTELPYESATSSGATQIQFRKANLKMDVTPQITPDGNIILDVDVNKDSVGIQTPAGFAIDTKHVQTQVLIENGGTVVLGGIFQQVERQDTSKVPFLGDLPVLGNLFKTTSKTNDKTELMFFITPKIVADKLSTR